MSSIAIRPDTCEERSTRVYLESIERHFSFLKAASTFEQFVTRGISLPGGGKLAPICSLHTTDEELIGLLARWRAENADAYPTQFRVTVAGTGRWLSQGVLDNPGRLTFLVLNRLGKPIGHMGLTHAMDPERSIEIDNVVRGEKESEPGLMTEALRALIQWTRNVIGPREIVLRVFKDNPHAIRFYARCGFAASREIPLVKRVDGETIRFEEVGDDSPPDRTFLVMSHVAEASSVGEKMILTAGPSISAVEADYVLDAARNGWNGQWNKYISAFERRFAQFVGRRFAISTSSCTGSLHLALLACGVGPGDEVIVPDITWVATANAVLYTGAVPVFCDVDAKTWCMDPVSLEKKIGPRTKAIMPVHLYGHPAAMHLIMPIARRHGLKVIEDAAPSIGAECFGQRTGSFGDAASFSFQGAKLLVTGEGGMFVTDDEAIYERAQSLADQGRDPSRTFWIKELGWKYKMSNVQAALGLGQLERADELVERKRQIFDWYRQDLSGVPGIELNEEAEYARSIYWMSSILVGPEAGIGRDELMALLKAQNIDTRPVFPAISQYPYWPKPQAPQPVAKRIGENAINLPSGVLLARDEVAYVCRKIRDLVA
jgi:perosamine synthetase